jgi:regulator of protease activity HflC (stomatin/prohibitin superfamily)
VTYREPRCDVICRQQKARFDVKYWLSCAALLLLSACGAQIRPGQAGLMYRARGNPALTNNVLVAGRYKVWGWRQLIVYDITSQNRDEVVHVLTADNLALPVTVTATFHPQREHLYELHTQIGQSYYEKLIGPAFITLVRAEFSKHQHNDLAKESPVIEKTVHDRLNEIAASHFITIDQIAIRHIDYDDTVTSAISRKIATRQQAEQKVYEVQIAERDAEIARTAARGRADSTRIQAEGDAAGILARGAAQAEAQEKLGKTLTPAYLQFKAFDNKDASYFFVPTGKEGLPIIIDAGAKKAPR